MINVQILLKLCLYIVITREISLTALLACYLGPAQRREHPGHLLGRDAAVAADVERLEDEPDEVLGLGPVVRVERHGGGGGAAQDMVLVVLFGCCSGQLTAVTGHQARPARGLGPARGHCMVTTPTLHHRHGADRDSEQELFVSSRYLNLIIMIRMSERQSMK